MGAISYAVLRDTEFDGSRTHLGSRAPSFRLVVSMAALLTISATFNLYFVFQSYTSPLGSLDILPSRYAQLPRNVTATFLNFTDHESTDRVVQDKAWSDPELDWGVNVVALDEHQVSALHLPQAQAWPWDSSKKLYVLNGAHDLHCIHMIRISINERYDGVPEGQQSTPYSHVIHCLNVLRQSVMCNADDTPLYMGRINANANSSHPKPGVGFGKTCRDLNALNAWSRAHSACYKPVDYFNHGFPDIDRFKFCPDGSKPWLKT